MGESYRTINDISSENGYKKGSFVDSVVSDLRVNENEKKLVEKLISCNRCTYPEAVKYRDSDTIPGITILGYNLKPCGRIPDEIFPSRLCGKGLLKKLQSVISIVGTARMLSAQEPSKFLMMEE